MMPPEDPATRKARQFAQLREIGELAMSVARVSAQAAAEALEQPPTPEAQSRAAEHALTFARASRAVRDAIALEHRLAAEPHPRRGHTYVTPDPHRALLRRVLHDAVSADPGRAQRRREIDDRIEHELQADPAAAQPLIDTFGALCDYLDLQIDPARLPDEILGLTKPPNRLNL